MMVAILILPSGISYSSPFIINSTYLATIANSRWLSSPFPMIASRAQARLSKPFKLPERVYKESAEPRPVDLSMYNQVLNIACVPSFRGLPSRNLGSRMTSRFEYTFESQLLHVAVR